MKIMLTSAALWLALPGALSAQMGLPQDITDGFYVTVEEVREHSEAVFRAFGDGGTDPIPKEAFVTADIPSDIVPDLPDRDLLRRLFEFADADGDGVLTHAEWARRIERDLAFADADGDGRITLRELATARSEMGVGDALGMIF